jgi:hypothetical protein
VCVYIYIYIYIYTYFMSKKHRGRSSHSTDEISLLRLLGPQNEVERSKEAEFSG